jgi:hypothetical protein
MTTTVPISDLYRIVGEYLADPRLRVESFSALSGSIRLSVADVDSIRYAHSLIVVSRYSYVGTVAHHDDQSVNVVFERADRVYVSVSLTVTDPDLIARLRAAAEPYAGRAARVLAVLATDPAPEREVA